MSTVLPDRKAAIDQTIELLAHVKKRKSMYFQYTVEHAESFLGGFRAALMAIGVPLTWHSQHILRSRGWTSSSVGFAPSMREKGLTETEIMDELIEALMEELRQVSAVCNG